MATSYSIIPIIICVIVTLFVVSFISALCSEPKGQRNNVHYYVTKDCWYNTVLWLGKPEWDKKVGVWYASPSTHAISVCRGYCFVDYKLNLDDFLDMKNGEIREVFINMED